MDPILILTFRISMMVFCDGLKTARIKSIPKNETKPLSSNYHPIAILSVLINVVESLCEYKLINNK